MMENGLQYINYYNADEEYVYIYMENWRNGDNLLSIETHYLCNLYSNIYLINYDKKQETYCSKQQDIINQQHFLRISSSTIMQPENPILIQQILLKQLPDSTSLEQLNKGITTFLEAIKGQDFVRIDMHTIRLEYQIRNNALKQKTQEFDRLLTFLLPYIEQIHVSNIEASQTSYNIKMTKILQLIASVKFPKLTSVKLKGSQQIKIQQVPIFNYPQNISHLEVISLPENRIKNIDNILIGNLNKLRYFTMESNQVEDFSGLSRNIKGGNLKVLDLTDNLINTICWIGQLDAPLLEVLRLGSNNIRSIKILRRTHFPNLRQLEMRNNYITDFSPLWKMSSKVLSIHFLGSKKVGFLQPYIYYAAKLPDTYACDYRSGEFDFSQISTGFLLGGHIPYGYRQQIKKCRNVIRDKLRQGRFMKTI